MKPNQKRFISFILCLALCQCLINIDTTVSHASTSIDWSEWAYGDRVSEYGKWPADNIIPQREKLVWIKTFQDFNIDNTYTIAHPTIYQYNENNWLLLYDVKCNNDVEDYWDIYIGSKPYKSYDTPWWEAPLEGKKKVHIQLKIGNSYQYDLEDSWALYNEGDAISRKQTISLVASDLSADDFSMTVHLDERYGQECDMKNRIAPVEQRDLSVIPKGSIWQSQHFMKSHWKWKKNIKDQPVTDKTDVRVINPTLYYDDNDNLYYLFFDLEKLGDNDIDLNKIKNKPVIKFLYEDGTYNNSYCKTFQFHYSDSGYVEDFDALNNNGYCTVCLGEYTDKYCNLSGVEIDLGLEELESGTIETAPPVTASPTPIPEPDWSDWAFSDHESEYGKWPANNVIPTREKLTWKKTFDDVILDDAIKIKHPTVYTWLPEGEQWYSYILLFDYEYLKDVDANWWQVPVGSDPDEIFAKTRYLWYELMPFEARKAIYMDLKYKLNSVIEFPEINDVEREKGFTGSSSWCGNVSMEEPDNDFYFNISMREAYGQEYDMTERKAPVEQRDLSVVPKGSIWRNQQFVMSNLQWIKNIPDQAVSEDGKVRVINPTVYYDTYKNTNYLIFDIEKLCDEEIDVDTLRNNPVFRYTYDDVEIKNKRKDSEPNLNWGYRSDWESINECGYCTVCFESRNNKMRHLTNVEVDLDLTQEETIWVSPSPDTTIHPTDVPASTSPASSTAVSEATPTVTPSETPKSVPTNSPTLEPTQSPAVLPSVVPTGEPTVTPAVSPSATQESAPANSPTLDPTQSPAVLPSAVPTGGSTVTPTIEPTASPPSTTGLVPTNSPTLEPIQSPAVVPSMKPTGEPSATQESVSTSSPSPEPSQSPVIEPSAHPTGEPTATQETVPTNMPTLEPAFTPSETQEPVPTNIPALKPTQSPTVVPSIKPTGEPSATHEPVPTNIPALEPIQSLSVAPGIDSTSTPAVVPDAIQPKDSEKPNLSTNIQLPAPKLKKIKGNENEAKLKWNKISQLTGYEIWRSRDSKSFKHIASTQKTTYINTGLSYGSSYRFKVRAYKAIGKEIIYGTFSKIRTKKIPSMKTPVIKAVMKKYDSLTKYIKINISSYSGNYVEVYYRMLNGTYKKVKLKSEHIRKRKPYVRIGYSGNKTLEIRVRTYKIKSKRKVFSPFSDKKRLRTRIV